MERLQIFLPAIAGAASLALLTIIFVRLAIKKLGQENLQSTEWVKNNLLKVSLLIGTPIANVLAPTAEELFFRAPIIVMFPDMGGHAWTAILISAVLFSLAHIREKNLGVNEILNTKTLNDNLNEREQQAEQTLDRSEKRLRMVFRLGATFVLGVIAGYFGVKHQSLWLAIGIHSLWNLVMPVLVSILLLFLVLAFQAMSALLAVSHQKYLQWKEKWNRNE